MSRSEKRVYLEAMRRRYRRVSVLKKTKILRVF